MSTSNARESPHSRAKGRTPTRFAKRAFVYRALVGRLLCIAVGADYLLPRHHSPRANGGRLGLHPDHALDWLAGNALRRIERLGVIGGYGQRLNQMQIFTRFWPFIPC